MRLIEKEGSTVGTFEVEGLTPSDKNAAFKHAMHFFRTNREEAQAIYNIQSGRLTERIISTGLVVMLMDYVKHIESKVNGG